MKISLLTKALEPAYTSFLLSHSEALLYASLPYRDLLQDFLQAQPVYFIATNDAGDIKGALPGFLRKNEETGNVLNSLPFYGSNGGVVEFNNDLNLRRMLLNAFNEFAEAERCVSSTLITSP